MSKSIPISVRISSEEADFIARMQIDDAVTPSDKIRAIIRNARLMDERGNDFDGSLKSARENLRHISQLVKTCELDAKTHSELVSIFLDWVAEAYAYTASAQSTDGNKRSLDIAEFEAGIADRCFRLLEIIARMGVTSKAPCYDKDIITKGLQPLEELTHLINLRINKKDK